MHFWQNPSKMILSNKTKVINIIIQINFGKQELANGLALINSLKNLMCNWIVLHMKIHVTIFSTILIWFTCLYYF